MNITRSVLVILAVCGLTLGCSLAQRTMPGTMSDANVLAVLDTIDRSEIEAAELAKQRAHSPATRDYATRLISEHHRMLEKNQQVADRVRLRPEPPQLATSLNSTHHETLDRLRKLSGPEFDRAYLEYQVKMHEEAITLIQDTAKSADHLELKQHLTKALPDLQSHLNQAKAVQEQLARRG